MNHLKPNILNVMMLLACMAGFTALKGQTVRVFTVSDTFTVPACVDTIIVMCWGAGGGGGAAGEAASGAAGSGGGGGGFAKAVLINVSGTFTITVGAFGTGGINDSDGIAGGSSIFTNGVIAVTALGGGAGIGSSTGVAPTGGAGGGGTFAGCAGTFYTGGSGAIGNNEDDNTGGGGGGGAGNAGNGQTPAATTRDNNATGGTGGLGNPNTVQYAGGSGGGATAAYYENGDTATGIAGGGGGGGGENQFFHGSGSGTGGNGGPGQVIIIYSVSAPTITSVMSSSCDDRTITINGTLLTDAGNATINGTALTGLTVVSDTQITGTVAEGTTSGRVTVTTPCGIAVAPDSFYLPVCTGVKQISGNNPIIICPNPSTGQLIIEIQNFSPKTIAIYDDAGRLINTQPFKTETDISMLSSGVYFMEVAGNEGVIRKRVIKM